MNMARMLCSVKRLALPQFDPKEMLEILKLYVDMERDWIPKGHGYSLYLRPSMIGAQEWLGVGPSNRAIFFIIACPVGPYYKASGFHPVSLWAEDRYVRAWPGGTGCYKLGSNYSPGILPQVEVARKGYTQVLWLFGPEHDLTEVGTMNLFVLWRRHSDNAVELITPSLDDGTILPGITRDSILQLTRHWREVEVTEGRITMAQIQQALRDNRLIEMFGSGTAAVISPVDKIHYRGQDLKIPCLSGKRDSLSQRLWRELTDIQCGRKQFQDWSMVVPRRL
jgi:branched-chain amino acid aminotransferase